MRRFGLSRVVRVGDHRETVAEVNALLVGRQGIDAVSHGSPGSGRRGIGVGHVNDAKIWVNSAAAVRRVVVCDYVVAYVEIGEQVGAAGNRRPGDRSVLGDI